MDGKRNPRLSESLIKSWLKNHMLSQEWYCVRAHLRKFDKKPYIVLHTLNKENEYPWCLQCSGNGHYFKTKKEMKHYMWDNNWVTKPCEMLKGGNM